MSAEIIVCDGCGATDSAIPGRDLFTCGKCGSEAAWTFTDARSAIEYAAQVQNRRAGVSVSGEADQG